MENELVKQSPTPAILLQQAIMNKFDIDRLKELIELQNDFEKKQAEKAFNLAMSNFQKNKPEIKKTKSGYDNRYKYAPLPQIQRQIDPILSEFGLSYKWKQKIENDKIIVTCIATHIDGHFEETSLIAAFDKSGNKSDIQAMGSTNTYLFRYTLCSLFGLSSEDDNDGAGSRKKPENKEKNDTELLINAMNELESLEKEKLSPVALKNKLNKIWKDYAQFRNHEAFKIKVTNLNKKCLKEQKPKTEML